MDPDTLYIYCVDRYCESYTEEKDPSKYCQTCGKPKDGDITEICRTFISETNCTLCGQFVKRRECHTCKQEDIDAYN